MSPRYYVLNVRIQSKHGFYCRVDFNKWLWYFGNIYLSWSFLRHSLALLLLHRPTFSYRDLLRNLFFNNIAFGDIYFLANIFGNWFCNRWTLLSGDLFANIPVHIDGYFLFNLNAFLTWNYDAFWNLFAFLSFLAIRRILNNWRIRIIRITCVMIKAIPCVYRTISTIIHSDNCFG